jgi:tetratricopeptide (TPR) repeat protein
MYEKLGDTPELRGHALVNIGFLYMLAHRHGEARANLQRAAAPAHDADIRHVAHLLLGWIDLREKKQDEAISNFQAALNISPHGRTAAAWLGFQLMLKGRLTEAEEAAQTSLDPGRRPLDPWRLFGMGDYRRFPDLIKLIRKAIS